MFQGEVVRRLDCDHCSFTSTEKVTMNQHMVTKHKSNISIETRLNFIFCLKLEEYAEEYKDNLRDMVTHIWTLLALF